MFYTFGESIRVEFFFFSPTATDAFVRTWVKPAIIDACTSGAYSPSSCTGSPQSFALTKQILCCTLAAKHPQPLQILLHTLWPWWLHRYLRSDPSRYTGSGRAQNVGGSGNFTKVCLFMYLRVKQSAGTIETDWTAQKEEPGAWTRQATQGVCLSCRLPPHCCPAVPVAHHKSCTSLSRGRPNSWKCLWKCLTSQSNKERFHLARSINWCNPSR